VTGLTEGQCQTLLIGYKGLDQFPAGKEKNFRFANCLNPRVTDEEGAGNDVA